MKLTDIELSEKDAAGLARLLDKMGVSASTSRESSDLCRRTFGIEVRAASMDAEARSVEVIASTAALDSYDEIVEQDWRLERYRANPVVLYAHNAAGLCGPAEDTLPIGHASDVRLDGGRLVARLHFVDEKAAPMAERVWQGIKQGSLRAVSVGFRPHASIEEERDGKKIVHLQQNELYEISVCPIPANPEAVARSAERNRAQAIRLAAKTHEQGTKTMDAEKKIAELTAENEALKAKAAGFEEVIKTDAELLEKEQTARTAAETRAQVAEDRAEKAETALNRLEVERLVGRKLLPAEVEDFVELRATNRKLYDSIIEKKADLPHGKDVIPSDPTPPTVTAKSAGAELVELAQKQADGTESVGDDLASLALAQAG